MFVRLTIPPPKEGGFSLFYNKNINGWQEVFTGSLIVTLYQEVL